MPSTWPPQNEIGGLLDGTYYLARCKVEDATSIGWQNILLPGEGTTFQDMDIFSEHLVLLLENKGCSKMCSINLPIDINDKHVMELTDLNPWFFPVPSDLCRMVPGSNHDFMTSAYRVVLSSPVMPDLVIDYIMSQKTYSVVHQEEVVGVSPEAQSGSPGINLYREEVAPVKGEKDAPNQEKGVVHNWRDYSATYCCERHEVISHDGVQIPLTVIYSRSCVNKGQYPGLLHVYGAYGEELDKSWCPDRLSLLDRGWVIAFADVRGGSGGDSSWHQCGSGAHKINSIRDFISCGKYLIDEGYVKRDSLACIGYSAGSLVVGAAINFYSDFFRAAILKFIIGDGKNMYDFTYVENVAHAHICAERALASKGVVAEKASGEAYLVTNMEQFKFWEFMSLILEGLGYERPRIKIHASVMMTIAHLVELTYKLLAPYGMKVPQLTPPRIRLLSCDRTFNASKAKDRLGYTPIVSLQVLILARLVPFDIL